MTLSRELHQFFTPAWASERLVELFFPHLGKDDIVLEPSCGDGSFLKAIPDEVPAIGVEIDPVIASQARANTGRLVIDGDYRTANIPEKPTVIIGNPPYQSKLLEEFLDRSGKLLSNNQQAAFLLSVHLLQTPSAVIRWNEDWSMSQHLVPRTLFPRAIRPLSFVIFTKDKLRRLVGGFSLYHESNDVQGMAPKIKAILCDRTKSTWRSVVIEALQHLGGKATVQQIYEYAEPRRPSGNNWWREKIRQTLQRHCVSAERGVWQLEAA